MSGLPLVVTDAGLAALVNASSTGAAAVVVAEVGVTSTAFLPAPTLTALPGELKRLDTFAGANVGDRRVHVSIRDESAATYPLRGVALYLDDGTLFAAYGQADPIMEKSANAVLLLSADFDFGPGQAELIEFGATDFLNPQATTERVGVIELATDAEVDTGTDGERAVTPRGAARILAAAKTYTDTEVAEAVAALVNGSPGALDTLQELAAAMGNDPNLAATITNALALKAPLASPALTGNPTAPTQVGTDDSTRLATTAFVKARLAEEATARGTAIGAEATTRGNADTALNNRCAAIEDRLDNYGSNANGHWMIHPNGVIEQWGRYPGGSGEPDISFPIPFTEAASVNVQLTAVGTANWTADATADSNVKKANLKGAPTVNGFSAYCSAENGGTDIFEGSTTVAFHWRSIGK